MSAWVGFVSVFLLGLASGMSFSHLRLASWADFRDRWHLLHACRFVLSVVAFSAVIGGLVA